MLNNIALGLRAGILSAAMLATPAALAADTAPYLDSKQPLETRVEDALSRMTLAEKVGLLSGGASFATRGVERLGIPALNVSDGPNGLRSNASEPTTAFPTGVAIAATWDPALVERMGAAMGEEALAKHVQVILGPDVNIVRTPLAGRNFETYSEDPYLAGRIGVGFVDGVQSKGVGTSPKHYVANNQEHERGRGSSNVDERTLREIYLPAFERIVTKAKPWTVMAAYNRINGQYATENRFLMKDVLKGEWGFDGVLMSDWGAVHTTAGALSAGTDLEMPGPGRFRGDALVTAANNWQVAMADIDESARRMLRLILRTGVMDGKPLPRGELNSPAHQAIARDVAEEGIVLVKNDGDVLPIRRGSVKTLAVIGPNADVALIGGGGSSQVIPFHTVTALEGIRKLAGTDIAVGYEQGVDNEPIAPTADARLFSPTMDRKDTGLKATYYTNADFTGDVVNSETDGRFFKMSFSGGDVRARSMVMDGYFFPQQTGDYEFSLVDMAPASLAIDGTDIITEATRAEASPVLNFFPVHLRRASFHAEAGKDITVTYEQGADNEPIAPTADARLFSPTMERRETGLKSTYYANADFTGDVVNSETDGRFFKMSFSGGDLSAKSMTMDGYFFPQQTGDYEFSLVDMAPATLSIDGKDIITEATKAEDSPVLNFFPVHLRRASFHAEAGKAYKVRLAMVLTGGRLVMRLGLRQPPGSIEAAVKLAQSADAALVFVGVSTTSETEGADRTSMDLYGQQNELVEAVLKANPNTAIVLYNGAPLALPWLKDARAVVEAWLPGQEGGDAIARVLFGAVNPSGKMPVTFPRRIEDNPTYLYYPGTRDAFYGEGIFVGYRYYDTRKIDPLIPFGHGLSYTSFGYGDLSVKATKKGVGVSLDVRNSGGMDGKEVVQLYVRDIKSSEARPLKELKGFEKIDLKAGKRGTVGFDLGPRAFSYYDVHQHAWVCEAGDFELMAGASSRDIRATKTITLNSDCRLD